MDYLSETFSSCTLHKAFDAEWYSSQGQFERSLFASTHCFQQHEMCNENLVHSFREWKVKWKCFKIEIEKWNFSRILEKFLEIKKVLDLQTLTLECWKMVKIVRKVECLLYELLIVALQYWAISGNIGHEIFNPCLWYQIWRIFF